MPENVSLCPIWDKVRSEMLALEHNQREIERRANEKNPQPELLLDAANVKSTGAGSSKAFSGTVPRDEFWLLWACAAIHGEVSKGINVRIISDPSFFGGNRSGHSIDLADDDPSTSQINSPEILAGKTYWIPPGYRVEFAFQNMTSGLRGFGDSWFWRFKGRLGADIDLRSLINAFGT